MLEFNIRNQEISRIDSFSPAEKSVGYLVAKFNFKTEDWDGASKIAVFKNLKTKEEYDRILEEDACIVPSEVLSEKGQFEVSVYGLKDGQKITSDVATCNLNRTLSGGSMTEDNSLNAAEKLLLEAQSKLDKSGHAPNKFLGTDEKGNVVTKEQEEFSLEVANEEKLGGVKPLNKTDDMTLEVGVAKDGRLFAKGKSITVDSKLSEESENPVQNKVLTKEVIALKERNAKLKETIEKLQIKQTTDKASFHHITDSANMKVLDFGMEGKTEQETTSGKQLLDNSGIESATVEGVTFTVKEDGSIIANGTTGENIALFYVGTVTLDSSKEYILSGCGGTGSTSTYSIRINNNVTAFDDIGKGVTFSGGSGGKFKPFILIRANQTVSNVEFKPMIRLSSVTDTTYEPYTNGASPNPGFPQKIVNAGVYNEETGRYEHRFYTGNKNLLKLTGRNVLPEQDSASTVAREFTGNQIFVGISANNYMQPRVVKNYSIDDDSITLTTSGGSYGLGFDVPVKEGQTYIISDDNNNVNIKVGFFDSEGNYLSYLTLTGKSFTIPTGVSWLLVVFLSATTTETNITNIQLELDTVATEPVIHQSTKFTLTSPVPLTKWDYLTKRDGVWGWSIQAKEYNVSTEEASISPNNPDAEKIRIYITNITGPNNTECLCNLFRTSSYSGVYDGEWGIWWGNMICSYVQNELLEPYGYIYDSESTENSTNAKAAFKALLAEKGPIQVWVDMQEEQAFHPLPDEEQTLLNNLETYYGVTNLYNDQGCPMWLTYVNDTKLYVDQKLLEIQQAMI